jgi:amino acid adenylation domain-containing protein
LVGSCFERSIGAVVAALAILKAGGAYLPLDPAYPDARLTYQLKDSRVAVLLTQEKIAKRFHGGEWRVVTLDEAEVGAASDSADGANSVVTGDDLAYVMYTSGSTGRPKGVEITHKALLNLVCWHQRTFDVNPSDRASQLSSPGFDAAVWELWPYVTAGASVYMPDENLRYEPEALRDWLVANLITIAFAATPVAERMINLPWPSETALRVLLTGGDTLHTYPPLNLPFQVVNNYGPTECTVVASSGTVLPNERPDVAPSIGRPIVNTQIYILDEHMQQVPIGAVGEIHIGGAGLARGYLNHPELTAERFVPNPFTSDFNARLYKTGDLARYLPDGQISFLGRTDEQIKIRGCRIELNEITTVLSTHPMVEASLVLASEDTAGDKHLVAYIVAKSSSQPTGRNLRHFVGAHLPAFMVPDVFVRLDSMPVNANGKIDRLALPTATEANILRCETSACASTPTQQVLARIIEGLLRLEQVGMNDNFFLLGGNSLLGAQVIARVRETFAVELSLLSLFDHPTILELSSEIERLLFIKVNALTEDEVRLLMATRARDRL